MVNDIIEELLDLDMEPKLESLWWTSTHKHEDTRTLRVGGRDKVRDLPFCEVFDVLGYRFHRDGKRVRGAERSMCTLRSWWRVKYIYRSKTVPMTTQCKRVHSHVYSTVMNGSFWSAWEGQILRLTFRPRMRPDETWVGYKNKNIVIHEGLLEEDGLVAADGEKL